MASLPAILLAAGASRRLGQPKQLLRTPTCDADEHFSETLLEQTLRIALASSFHPVFIVLGAYADTIQNSAQLAGGVILKNLDWPEGMASSIRCGVQAVMQQQPEALGVLLLVCDQPALTCEHLQALQAAHRKYPSQIIASRYAERLGVPILAPRSFFSELLALTGDMGARNLLRAQKNNLIEIPFPGGEWDIDAPEDIAAR